MKRFAWITVLLAAAAVVLFLLFRCSQSRLSAMQEQYAQESAQLAAMQEELEEKQAELDSLTAAEADSITEKTKALAAEAEKLLEEIREISAKTEELLAQLPEKQKELELLKETKSFGLEVYDALREGYEKLQTYFSGN